MKKLFLTLIIAFSITISSKAQEGFSAQAGLSLVNTSVEVMGASASESEIGFYAGAGYQFDLSDKIALQPSLLFSLVKDLNSLYVPVMVKYNITDKFNIQAGPQINYLLEDIDKGAFGIDVSAGLGYLISDKLYAQARYGLQVSRTIDNYDINTLHIGIGYNF
ncbi:outer membrane beta-barrel protein [uncultured Lacinutrix sp.]|uniref:outer membrane beta-barrel protein n=1 Tax=uncultured Lacinutrix sp. TaxID=574032 RepID=UPI00261DE5ED|nr:outer membrane beta-barrel protein [uncultured Lacinutrix sp.]